MRKNYFSSVDAQSSQVIIKGLAKAVGEALTQGVNRVWLVSHAKSNLDGNISSAIGHDAVASLAKGNIVRSGTTEIVFYGERTLPYAGDGSVVVACYPNKKLLDKLDGMQNIPCLIVLPWRQEETLDWINAHAPEDIYGAVATTRSSVTNLVVERALETLLAMINTSTGIAHPSDKATVIDIFTKLKGAGETYTASEVRAWLVQKGMDPEHANDIRDIAENPSKFRAKTGSPLRTDILARWREEAGQ